MKKPIQAPHKIQHLQQDSQKYDYKHCIASFENKLQRKNDYSKNKITKSNKHHIDSKILGIVQITPSEKYPCKKEMNGTAIMATTLPFF